MNIFKTYYHFFDTYLCFTTNSEECNKEFQKVYGYFKTQEQESQINPAPSNRVLDHDKNIIQNHPHSSHHQADKLRDFLPQGIPPQAESQRDVERRDGINCSVEKSGSAYDIKAISKRYHLEYTLQGTLHPDVYLSLFSPVLYEVKDYFLIHAGSLSTPDNRSLFISAPSGFGKTTTTRELCKQGFKLLSDELAPLNIKTGLIHPYPRGMGVLKGSAKEIVPIPKEILGQISKPAFVVFLTLEKILEEESGKYIEVALNRIDDNIMHDFKNIDGIINVSVIQNRLFPMLRLLLKKDAFIVPEIQKTCDKNNVPIIYTLKGKTQAPDFNSTPKLNEISASEGIFELSQNILNVHNSALLEERFKNSRPKMIFELAGLMGKARFFTLTVGKLSVMTGLIKDLCKTTI